MIAAYPAVETIMDARLLELLCVELDLVRRQITEIAAMQADHDHLLNRIEAALTAALAEQQARRRTE